MLPTIEERELKLQELQDELCVRLTHQEKEVLVNFYKWFSEEVVKHCAEVAMVEEETFCGLSFGNVTSTEYEFDNLGCLEYNKPHNVYRVSKQSILNVLTKL